MSILEQIRGELKDAMRKRDQRRLDALRQIETDVAVAKSAPGFSGEIDDALYLSVLGAYVKKMKKAVGEYQNVGERGQEMVEKLSFEVEYLGRWLPVVLDEEATRALVAQTISNLGLSGPQSVGQVMGAVMKTHKGQIEGSLVKRLALELLQGS